MKAGLYPVLGPPASGKTALALDWALRVLERRGRVLWVGLPHQRAYVYRLLGARGAFLGLEFLSLQALYYRVLAEAGWLRPLLPGAGRVALVGEALRELMGPGVAPGEARLFARAIAELKRSGLSPFALPKEGEAGRLRRVYLAYERLKRGSLDYDDFRHKAIRAPLRLYPEPSLVVVDGFREVGPLDLRFLGAWPKGSRPPHPRGPSRGAHPLAGACPKAPEAGGPGPGQPGGGGPLPPEGPQAGPGP
jgi:ATP-dependent helicase/nuclease subunit B